MAQDLDILVGPTAATALRKKNEMAPIVSAALQSAFTTYNRDQEAQRGVVDKLGGPGDEVARMRSEVNGAIGKLEVAIREILATRQQEESQARRWIAVVGTVLVALVLISAAAPLLIGNSTGSWFPTLVSGLSVTGLLYILYSPVHKLIDMARERSGLIILPATYRIRVLSASSTEELGAIAKELFELLQKPTLVPDKPS